MFYTILPVTIIRAYLNAAPFRDFAFVHFCTSTFLKSYRNVEHADRKESAVSGPLSVVTQEKNARWPGPRTNDEWIRFTDKPTINHRSIVYQQTGRIRLASWILLLDFFTSYGRTAAYTSPTGITEFYPFLRYHPMSCPAPSPLLT